MSLKNYFEYKSVPVEYLVGLVNEISNLWKLWKVGGKHISQISLSQIPQISLSQISQIHYIISQSEIYICIPDRKYGISVWGRTTSNAWWFGRCTRCCTQQLQAEVKMHGPVGQHGAGVGSRHSRHWTEVWGGTIRAAACDGFQPKDNLHGPLGQNGAGGRLWVLPSQGWGMGWNSLLHATGASPRTRCGASLGTRRVVGRQQPTWLESLNGGVGLQGLYKVDGGGRQELIWSESLHE